ncbi:uncharacterized protein [Diabrotica undecimpunctata]|uniref:uncharacterized protein n=1 Tax=Diabrotica undecimpunctata TaxID=50387 RepID=UPI003B63B414
MDKSKLNEVVKALQDAHMYEDNMTEQDMQEIYKVISDSKDTAKEESRKNNESDEDMFEEPTIQTLTNVKNVDIEITPNNKESKSVFQPKTWTLDKKPLDIENVSTEEHKEENPPEDATKANIRFEDMLNPSEPMLKIIYHPKQFTNIQNCQKFLKADVPTKAMMLYSYHTNMERLRSKLARQSFCTVAMPKPIVLKEQVIPSLERDDDFEDTYISRSGRQTKRKCYYTDDENTLEEKPLTSSNKKQKSKNEDEQEWVSKTKSASKTVAKKLDLTPKLDSQKFMEIESIEDEKKEIQNDDKKEAAKPRSKKLTNTEIMNRSSLFAEPPKRRTPRCELMFDKLKEEIVKKQKEEKTLEIFEKSLDMEADDSQSDSQKDEDIISIVEEPVRRRVIPTIPTKRKPIGNRNKQQQTNSPSPLNITIESASTSVQKQKVNSSDDILDRIVSSRTRQNDTSAVKENGVTVSSSTSVGSSTDVSCPICSKLFSKDSIQEHASSCGEEEQMVTRYSSQAPSKLRTCEICDKVIFDDYNLHVQQCLDQEKLNNKRK